MVKLLVSRNRPWMLHCSTVLGPSTVRDTAGSFANVMGGDPWYNASVHGNNEFLSEGLYIGSRL